jgi:ketosteroid isomerase-like protein
MDTHDVVARFVATLEARDWDAWSALLHLDVVYEIPQSRERIRGRERYLRFNREFPGDWHLTPKRVVAEGGSGVCWFGWRVGDESADAVVFLTVDADGLVTEVTDFWPEPYDPPTGREHLVERW